MKSGNGSILITPFNFAISDHGIQSDEDRGVGQLPAIEQVTSELTYSNNAAYRNTTPNFSLGDFDLTAFIGVHRQSALLQGTGIGECRCQCTPLKQLHCSLSILSSRL